MSNTVEYTDEVEELLQIAVSNAVEDLVLDIFPEVEDVEKYIMMVQVSETGTKALISQYWDVNGPVLLFMVANSFSETELQIKRRLFASAFVSSLELVLNILYRTLAKLYPTDGDREKKYAEHHNSKSARRDEEASALAVTMIK